jgi:hypothetical protein
MALNGLCVDQLLWLSFPSFSFTFSFTHFLALQIKPQKKETTQHHSTGIASGELLRLVYKMLQEY